MKIEEFGFVSAQGQWWSLSVVFAAQVTFYTMVGGMLPEARVAWRECLGMPHAAHTV